MCRTAGFPPEEAPPAAVFVDLDGTLIRRSSEKLFMQHLLGAGLVRPAGIVRFLAGYLLHPAVTLRSGKGWNRGYLRGLRAEDLAGRAEAFARERLSGLLRPGTLEAVTVLVGRGWRAVLMSASLEPLAIAIAEGKGFHEVIASRPEVVGGHLSGEIEGPRPWGAGKVELARRWCSARGIPPEDCLAMGDSWSDRHLMRWCGRAVAVCPDRRLRRLALESGWDVVEGRHTAWA